MNIITWSGMDKWVEKIEMELRIKEKKKEEKKMRKQIKKKK